MLPVIISDGTFVRRTIGKVVGPSSGHFCPPRAR
jgi:hypothetical protein